MATVKALTRKNKINSKGECVVYLRYGHKQQTKDISSGIKIPANNWDESKELVNSAKGIRKTKHNQALLKQFERSDAVFNTSIGKEKASLLEIANTLKLENKEPYADLVKEKYLEHKSEKKDSKDLALELFESFITNSSKSEGTKANYRTAKYHLKKFEEFTNRRYRLYEIDLKWIDAYKRFLYKDIERGERAKDKGKGISDNSVGTTVKNLKVFLRYLKDRNYNVPDIIDKIKVPRIEKTIIFLTEEELNQLSNYSFSEEKYEKVRDVFVLNCYTGLRYSDLQRLNKHHIQDGAIEMRAYKNQKDLYVPLTSKPQQILEKYNYELPSLSEQKFNAYIKRACEKAEINKQVELIKTASGNKSYEYVPKWKVITSHIAIKTFISLCGKKGISPKAVSEITGKSVEIIIKHYYGIDKETIKEQMNRVF
ncbi:phage integrase SAM-like domain-containing protein [Ekhidna sp.]|uniref:phage integrase SAM-like domain-containing protein n=1 Tax=Ekhidna sp. TaxID=2608089 RepID=UPI0032985995